MRRDRSILILVLLVLATGATFLLRSKGAPPVVGFAYTRTGAHYLDLARAALTEQGLPVPRFVYDSAAPTETSDGALTLAAAFAADPQVAVVVGPSNSRHALVTAPSYNAAGLPHIVPSATNRRLQGAGPSTFLLAPDDSVEGEFLARFAHRDLGARHAVVFYVNDEYGEGLRAGIVAAFTALGGVVAEAIPVGDDLDIDALMGSVARRHRPEVIFAAARSGETGRLLRTVQRYAPGLPVVAGDGAYFPEQLLSAAEGDLTELYVLAFWVYDSTDPAHRAFAARVRRVFGTDPSPEDALTEDALLLAAEARRVAGLDRGAIRRWLTGLGRDRPPFQGLTGAISFGPGRELPLTMVRFRGGKVERVTGSLVASMPSP